MKGRLGNKIRTLTCISCGTVRTDHIRPHTRYCTLECYRRSTKPQRRTGRVETCLECSAKFYVPRNRREASFCSRLCAHTRQRRTKIPVQCLTCSTRIDCSPSRVRRFCSIKCRDGNADYVARVRVASAAAAMVFPNRFERAAYAVLDSLGIFYTPQHVVSGKFTVDAFVPSARLVVQFDGDYWHGNPSQFETLDARQSKRVALDRSQDAYMAKIGLRVLRIWESEFRRDRQAVVEVIKARVAGDAPLLNRVGGG